MRRPRFLRVVVDPTDRGEGRINLWIPLGLLRNVARLPRLVPTPARTRIIAQLTRWGVPIDFTRLEPGQLEELVEHLDELTVDIDQPDTRVRIFCQ